MVEKVTAEFFIALQNLLKKHIGNLNTYNHQGAVFRIFCLL